MKSIKEIKSSFKKYSKPEILKVHTVNDTSEHVSFEEEDIDRKYVIVNGCIQFVNIEDGSIEA